MRATRLLCPLIYLAMALTTVGCTNRDTLPIGGGDSLTVDTSQLQSEASCYAVLAMVAAFIAVLAATFAVFFYCRLCRLDRRHRFLVARLAELEGCETVPCPVHDVTADASADGSHLQAPSETADGSHPQAPSEAGAHAADTTVRDTTVRDTIVRERLYLNPQFDRQASMDYFHLSKERIGAAFAQDDEHSTIADFINHCRLEYAKELLVTCLEMSVDDIASASGFSTRRTFSRLFKDRYSITPTEYRNQKN